MWPRGTQLPLLQGLTDHTLQRGRWWGVCGGMGRNLPVPVYQGLQALRAQSMGKHRTIWLIQQTWRGALGDGMDTLEGTCPSLGTLWKTVVKPYHSPPAPVTPVLHRHRQLHLASAMLPSPQGLCTGCTLLEIPFSTLFTSFLLICDSNNTSSGALPLIPTLPTWPGSALFAYYPPILLSHPFSSVKFMGRDQGSFAYV